MTPPPHDGLLDEVTVLPFLHGAGFDLGPHPVAHRLSGGVSSVVLRVEGEARSAVVKQARAVLDVPDYWAADPERSHYEGAALQLMSELTPGHVPALLFEDRRSHVLVLEAAPTTWRQHKDELLRGTASASVSASVGLILASLHAGTAGSASVAAAFDRRNDLEALRIQPYFRSVQTSHAEHAGLMQAVIAFLESPGRCLVHGDATPKNVLVGDAEEVWLLDPEVAHYGQPELDVAMWCGHLLLKAHRDGPQANLAERALTEFCNAYLSSQAAAALDDAALRRLVAAMVVARLHGLSRIDYTSELDLDRLSHTIALLMKPATDVWSLLLDAHKVSQ